MVKILVTGGAGYIGSNCAIALLEAGYEVVILDNLSTGKQELVPHKAKLIIGDVGDRKILSELFSEHDFSAIIHFAGSIIVSESVSNPLKYYDNNTNNSRILLEESVKAKIKNFIFSSTAAVYGEPKKVPISESENINPINPYGRSKLMTEMMLHDVANCTKDFSYGILRYFNVAGADLKLRSGQIIDNPTHLIKVAMEAATGKRSHIDIFGSDYPSKDGTCIRDFIHVTDLAHAHLVILEQLLQNNKSVTVNAGYGEGFTVQEVIDLAKKVSETNFTVNKTARREGDPFKVIANSEKLKSFGWKPRYNNLELIIESSYKWERHLTTSRILP